MQIADIMQGVNLSTFHPISLLQKKRVVISRDCSQSSSLGLQFLVNDMQPDSIAAPLHLRHQVPDLFDALHLLERHWHLHHKGWLACSPKKCSSRKSVRWASPCPPATLCRSSKAAFTVFSSSSEACSQPGVNISSLVA